MALIACGDCGEQYSNKLPSCPACEGKGITSQLQQANSNDAAAGPDKEHTTAKLVELKQLHDSGDLSDAEFALAKSKILGVENNDPDSPSIQTNRSTRKSKVLGTAVALLAFTAVAYFLFLSVTRDNTKTTDISGEPSQSENAKPDGVQISDAENTGTESILQPNKPESAGNTIETLAKKAEAGDRDAAFELGQMYWYGQGADRDKKKAYGWFELAADQGDASSQYIIGMEYYMGVVGPKDRVAAAEWFLKAASQGYIDAQFNLGKMYYSGIGVPQLFNKAATWFTEAAKQGHMGAQLQIGYMHDSGKGLAVNHYEAVKWYLKAAEQGNLSAQFNIGNLYSQGEGVPQSYPNAMKWWRRAAMQGHSGALNNLGMYYAQDDIFPTAYAYYTLAAQQGSAVGEENREDLWHRLVFLGRIGDATEGRKIAREWGAVIAFNIASRPKPKPKGELIPKPYWALKLRGNGTGFFVTKNGYLLTNYHVVKGARRVEIRTTNGIRMEALVVKEDRLNDLAILKVDGEDFKPLPIAQSESVGLGEDVFTVGFPQISIQGMSEKLTKGSISALAGMRDDDSRFQTSTPVQPGNSGGALMDHHGNVIGVIVSKLRNDVGFDSQNVNYAIKAALAKKLLDTIPGINGKLVKPHPRNNSRPFTQEVAKKTQAAAVMVLKY